MKYHFRQTAVRIHRWLGLIIAGFLLSAGMTGAVLAWSDELEGLINPGLFKVDPVAGSQAMQDPLQLLPLVQARYPATEILRVPLAQSRERALIFGLTLQQKDGEPVYEQVFVDPYRGQILGSRHWGDIRQGVKNLMPFVYRFHYSLALGPLASTVFGIVAVLWTLDCFAGVYLTFPAPQRKAARQDAPSAGSTRKSWLRRWLVSWKIRATGGGYKLMFDLHRATSLWLWAMLWVLAWSSVSFNLPQVYTPVMKALFASQTEPAASHLPARAIAQAKPDWFAARAQGRKLMGLLAQKHGFTILEEDSIRYDPRTAQYSYSVRSSRDVSQRWGSTQVFFDGQSGIYRGMWLPSGVASGDTIQSWLTSLHMAALGGVAFKSFISLVGLATAMLSVTGLVIWWKKRKGRLKSKPGSRKV